MSSSSIISIIVIIVAVILVDVFCGDVTNTRSASPRQNNSNTDQKLLDGGSSSPRPASGVRRRIQNLNLNGNTPQSERVTTPSPKKWIQQNSVWIRNEQAAAGGDVGIGQQNSGVVKSSIDQNNLQQGSAVNQQNLGGSRQNSRQNLRGQQQNLVASSINNPQTNVSSQIHQTNRQQALIDGLGGKTQNLGTVDSDLNPQNTNLRSANPPVHQTNKQQALISGLGGNQQNLGPANPSLPPQNVNKPPSAAPSTKPISYAGAVGSRTPPISPNAPKSPPIFPPVSPQSGGSQKDKIPSTGPTSNNENLDDLSSVGPGDASDDELRQFSEMLLRKDSNNSMKYVTLNLQGMTTSRSETDEAPLPLLKIEADAFKIPTIEKMMLLYNNYFLQSNENEVYTGQERIEENNLLDAVLATPVMQYARSFLIQKGKIGKDPKEFRDLLRVIWFNMYSRGQGRIGSSGFEHVFLAELKNNQVSGLHNWLYFHEEEKQNRANYLGYMKKLDLGDKGAVLKYHFTFHGIDKPVGSMFIGTSPELELALYSTCFVLRADKICPLKMNNNKFIIRTYTFRYRGKNMLGSAFPEI